MINLKTYAPVNGRMKPYPNGKYCNAEKANDIFNHLTNLRNSEKTKSANLDMKLTSAESTIELQVNIIDRLQEELKSSRRR